MESILEAIYEGFAFIGHADPAAKVEHRIVIVQGQNLQKGLQFFEAFPDAWRVVFVGFCVGTVKLIQHRFAIRIAGIKYVVLGAPFQ